MIRSQIIIKYAEYSSQLFVQMFLNIRRCIYITMKGNIPKLC